MRLTGSIILAALVLVSYFPATRNAYIWDDDDYIKDLPALRNVQGLRDIWLTIDRPVTPQYYPLVFTTFWVEYHAWQLNWLGYHIDNILLHLANALLLWLVLRKLKIPAAWFAAAIFAVHPIETESVAWMSERKNVLCLLFYLLAALSYIKADALAPDSALSPEFATKNSGQSPRLAIALWLIAAFLCYVCALFSKTVTSTLPASLLVLTWWKRGTIKKRDLYWTLPMIVAGLTLMYRTASLESEHVGASGPEFDFSTADRLLIAGRALWFYAGKIVWPHPLLFMYPQWKLDPKAPWQWLFPIGAMVVFVVLYSCRKRIGRGPLAAVLFFAGTVFPALGFVNIYPMLYSFAADHFQYIAGIGIIVLIASGLDWLGRKYIVNLQLRRLAAAVILFSLAALTWRQCGIYYDRATLWLDTVQKDNSSEIGWTNLASIVPEHPHLEEQLDLFKKASTVFPDLPPPADANLQQFLSDPNVPAARRKLLEAMNGDKKLDAEVDQYAVMVFLKKAVAVQPERAMPHVNLARWLKTRDPAAAEREFKEALRIDPDLEVALDDYAGFLFNARRIPEAIALWNRYVDKHVNERFVAIIYSKLGLAYESEHQIDEALGEYATSAAASERDNDVYGDQMLGLALMRFGRMEQALPRFQYVVDHQPENYQAQIELAQAQEILQLYPEAQAHFRAAIALKPSDPSAHALLGELYLTLGRFDGAMAEYQIAMSLDPQNPRWRDKLAAIQRAATMPAQSHE